MKIAITADLHLTSRERHPDRFETFENLLSDLVKENTGILIIAGDLFDESGRDYSDFDSICSRPEYESIEIVVIPGNHDADIDNKQIASGNVRIVEEPKIVTNWGAHRFLLLPYRANKTMGDVIASMASDLPPDEWILIGHGDWAEGLRELNPTEKGVYMPLSRQVIQTYRPAKVFLGHIHMAADQPIYYVGSPCGLDISETGRRSFVIYDTDTNQVERRQLDTPVLYFSASYVMVPVEDEAGHLRSMIRDTKDRWKLEPEETNKAKIRISIRGYSSDRSLLQSVLDEEFKGYTFYKDEKPNVDEVLVSEDIDRLTIAEDVERAIDELDWHDEQDLTGKDDIRLAALRIIYGD